MSISTQKTRRVFSRYETIDRKVKDGRWFLGGVAWTNETRAIKISGPAAIAYGVAVVKKADTQDRVAFSEAWLHRNGAWRLVLMQFHTLKTEQ